MVWNLKIQVCGSRFSVLSDLKLIQYDHGKLGLQRPTTPEARIANYLQGPQTLVDFQGPKLKFRKAKPGVPQGGVLSEYLRDLPEPPSDIELIVLHPTDFR